MMNKNKGIQKFGIFIAILALAVLSCQGAAGFNPFATTTPTPTLTFTPSPTFTPSQTPSPTQTPSPVPLPTGVTMEEQSDGSTLFVDYDNQYQLNIPKAWFVIPLSSDDILDILKGLSEKNPALQDTAKLWAQLDPDVIRVIAINENKQYIFNGYSTNITVTAVDDKILSSMPLDLVTGAMEEALKQQGATLLPSQSPTASNTHGVEIGSFEYQQTAPTATGASVQVQAKALIFQANGKLIMIQLALPKQFAKELLPVMDQIKDTVQLLEP
jgi:hypothetical protein